MTSLVPGEHVGMGLRVTVPTTAKFRAHQTRVNSAIKLGPPPHARDS
ncbi:MAG: hypothetical protein QOI10_4390 [Solirubrobacterales bacterium]|jgi:hypothetical protein|nr:hypothetical protein [Solirubrobacterales bacterium]